jgi:hypothetical protein
MRRAFGLLLVILSVAACSSPPANVPASGGTTVTGPGELPPISAIWFGTAFDPATLALTDKGNTFKSGTPIVLIATLTAPRTPDVLSVKIETSGNVRATLPVPGPGVGNTYGVDLTSANLGPGPYLVSIVDKDRKSLASASFNITP